MKRAIAVTVVLLGIAFLVLQLATHEPAATEAEELPLGPGAPEAVSPPAAVTSPSPTPQAPSRSAPGQQQASAQDLAAADLAAAERAVTAAEARLEQLSLQLDGLEAQVSDIEARGDDPADHVDEVMPYMKPVLDEFLDAQAELDAALTRLEELRSTPGEVERP